MMAPEQSTQKTTKQNSNAKGSLAVPSSSKEEVVRNCIHSEFGSISNMWFKLRIARLGLRGSIKTTTESPS